MIKIVLVELLQYWWLIPIGVTVGIFVGAVPGFSSTNVLIILLPLTLGMQTAPALTFMACLYAGSHMGGSIPAILVNVPGTGSAACTCLDGYPMTQKGQAQEALAIAFIASAIGGLLTTATTFLALPYLRRLVYYFGTIENFILIVFGIALIAQIASKDPLKGFIGGSFGLLIGAIGYDHVYSVPRATFGILELFDGVPRVPVLVGLFAISEALIMIEKETIVDSKNIREKLKGGWKATIRGVKISFMNIIDIIRSAFIGFFIGIVPGAGATIGSFVSYQQAISFSKEEDKKKFGTGHPPGVIASEAANNGLTSGSLIPLLALGIPGGGTAAVMLVVLQYHGVPIGPRLFTTVPELAYGLVLSMLLGYIVLLIVGLPSTRLMARMAYIPTRILVPIILSFTIIGGFVERRYFFDMKLALIFGILGYIMKKTGYSVHAILLGVILGPLAERYFLRALMLSDGNPAIFFSRPVGNILWVLFVFSLIGPTIYKKFIKKKAISENY